MVIDARSSSRSMDPVDLFTKDSRVEHARVGDQIDDDDRSDRPGVPGHDRRRAGAAPAVNDREWVTANDRIYWGNGVCDRTFYDAGLAARRWWRCPRRCEDRRCQTRGPSLIEPDPVAVTLFTDAIEFVVSPWENVDDLEA